MTLFISFLALFTTFGQAQSVDEIIDSYYKNTGGIEAWGNLKGIRIKAKVNQGGLEIPLEIVQLKDGRQYTSFTLQGQTLRQGVFDGVNLWSTNFATMKAEKCDEESTANGKLDMNDFPDSFYDYKKKGYKVELVGKETFDGTEAYKIKIVREPRKVDGVVSDDIIYYFFDAEAMIPIGQESEIKQGPAKGQISQIKLSDYQEVNGLYFPFSMSQGLKGGESQPLVIVSVEVNPSVSDSDFTFPN